MFNEDILQLETRKEIYSFILKNPGMHLSKISRELNMPRSTLRYHLNFMKKNELITELVKDKVTRFYVSKKISKIEKDYINLLRKKTSRRIILLFLVDLCLSRLEISRILEIHPNTVDFHLKKLLKLGIIRQADFSEDGIVFPRKKKFSRVLTRKNTINEVIYRLEAPGPRTICNLLIKYDDNLIEDEISKSIMHYINHQIKDITKHPLPKKIPNFPLSIDKVLDTYFDIFPVPFCA